MQTKFNYVVIFLANSNFLQYLPDKITSSDNDVKFMKRCNHITEKIELKQVFLITW